VSDVGLQLSSKGKRKSIATAVTDNFRYRRVNERLRRFSDNSSKSLPARRSKPGRIFDHGSSVLPFSSNDLSVGGSLGRADATASIVNYQSATMEEKSHLVAVPEYR
jgi:hypothetical protein